MSDTTPSHPSSIPPPPSASGKKRRLIRKVYETRRQKVADLVFGVILFLVLNGIFLLLTIGLFQFLDTSASDTTGFIILSFILQSFLIFPFIINIVLMIYFGLTRHWIALGMLAVIGFLLLVTLCVGVFLFIQCFITGSSNV